MLMARLPQPITNHFRLANPIELDGEKRGRGEGLEEHLDFIQRSWVFVFSCRLPLGYKSLLSSGKFSAVEHEGLNAIGFWWKTNLKKGKIQTKTEVMCFAFLCSSCDLCFSVRLRLQRDDYSKSVFSNQISKLIFVTASEKAIRVVELTTTIRNYEKIKTMIKETWKQLGQQWSSCISNERHVKNTCPPVLTYPKNDYEYNACSSEQFETTKKEMSDVKMINKNNIKYTETITCHNESYWQINKKMKTERMLSLCYQ